jgi:hypothetical protein
MESQVILEELNRRLLGTHYDSLEEYWVNCLCQYLPLLGLQRFGLSVFENGSIVYREQGLDNFDMHSIKTLLPQDAKYFEKESNSLIIVGMNSEDIKWVVVVVDAANFSDIQPIIISFDVPLLRYR